MITASIVTYKTQKEELLTVMQCLLSNTVSKIYVVDNSPTDDLKEVVETLSERVEYVFGQGNVGYGTAHNIAIHKAIENGSRYHFVTNSDIIIKEEIILPMIEYMQNEENVGMMMPKILNLDGTPQYLPKLLPSPFMLLLRKIKRPFKIYNNYMTKYELRDIDVICNVPLISGCFSLLNLSLLQKFEIGGYDERFFMYFEDFDLSRRFHQKCKTIYYPLVSVYHGYEGGANKSGRLFKVFVSSAIKYFNRWGWFFDRERSYFNAIILRELNIK